MKGSINSEFCRKWRAENIREKHNAENSEVVTTNVNLTSIQSQSDDFLNRYDFAYTGRDMVNTAMRGLSSIAPRLIKHLRKWAG